MDDKRVVPCVREKRKYSLNSFMPFDMAPLVHTQVLDCTDQAGSSPESKKEVLAGFVKVA